MSMYYSRPTDRTFSKSRKRYGGSSSRQTPRKAASKYGKYIDPSNFVRVAQPQVQEEYVATHSFADFAIDTVLKENIAAKGYVTPSPIQDQTIPIGLAGKDVIGVANTGTGKTAAFALPVLQQLLHDRMSNALIVAPTRELAQQIEVEIRSIAQGTQLNTALLTGGAGMGFQLRALRARPRVIIGTPGRIQDHAERGTLKLQYCNIVVLDEVDRMLDMGFLPVMQNILQSLASQRQSFFFSATLDEKVRGLISQFSSNPEVVSVKTGNTSDNVHQDVVAYQTKQDKLDKLHDTLIHPDVKKVIIFDETQRDVERLTKELQLRGFSANEIHGGKSQGHRQRALKQFKMNEITILVATDVAARGIDVADITHVINYGMPHTYEDYIHRIGRTGRAGNIGYALTFVTS